MDTTPLTLRGALRASPSGIAHDTISHATVSDRPSWRMRPFGKGWERTRWEVFITVDGFDLQYACRTLAECEARLAPFCAAMNTPARWTPDMRNAEQRLLSAIFGEG